MYADIGIVIVFPFDMVWEKNFAYPAIIFYCMSPCHTGNFFGHPITIFAYVKENLMDGIMDIIDIFMNECGLPWHHRYFIWMRIALPS